MAREVLPDQRVRDSSGVPKAPDPVDANPIWAVVHVDLARVLRIRPVIDFLATPFREDAELLEGRRPLP